MFRRLFVIFLMIILTNLVLETEKVEKIHMNCHHGQLCKVKKNTKVVIRVKLRPESLLSQFHRFLLMDSNSMDCYLQKK